MTTYFGKKQFIRFTASAFRKLPSIYVFSYFPFGFEGRMWDLIVSVPDHCLSFYFADGSLYNKLQGKLSESMLSRYHRWLFETSITESESALQKGVIQEAEFQTIAPETMHGLTGKADSQQPVQSLPRNRTQRTFFGESKNDRSTEKMPCLVCGGQHAIWRCGKFAQRS